MTSEGQHGGQRAAATSGDGGTEPATTSAAYGAARPAGSFPQDGDGQSPADPANPRSGWAPDAYPDSYGPPSYPPPGSGSPFVVPAVPVFGAGNGDAPAAGTRAPAFRSSAQVPDPANGAGSPTSVWGPPPGTSAADRDDARPVEPHPYRVMAVPDAPADAASDGPGHPYRDDADGHPYRASAAASGSAAVPAAPAESPDGDEPAPGTAPRPATADAMSGGPLPSRADRPPFGGPDGPGNPDAMSGFNGFVSASARGSSGRAGVAPGGTAQDAAAQDSAAQNSAAHDFAAPSFAAPNVAAPNVAAQGDADPGTDGSEPGGEARAPGISAFGGQRVRVPGAALSGLSDSPPAVQAGRPTDSGGFHMRGTSGGETGFASLPQPRTPVDAARSADDIAPAPAATAGAAVGTARPVTASASVPVASRVTPPAEREELPVSGGAGPRPRVYGRATTDEEQAAGDPAPVSPFTPDGDGHPYRDAADNGRQSGGAQHGRTQPGYGFHDADPAPPVGRATASARVTPPSGAAPFTPGAPPPYQPPVSPAAFTPAAPAFAPGGRPFAPGTQPYSAAAQPFTGHPGFPPGPPGPGQDAQVSKPYSEHTTDMSGRGRATAAPVEHAGAPFSEHTTDVARRGVPAGHPYAPPGGAAPGDGFSPAAPADNDRRPGRAQVGAVFSAPAHQVAPLHPSTAHQAAPLHQGSGHQGSGHQGTVTPPAQTETWPVPGAEAEQNRFDAFKPDNTAAAVPAATPAADKTEPPNVRMLPVLLGVILAAALLVGMAIGVVWLIARPSSSGFDVNAGDCVKRDGDKAVTATCGDPGSFQVVSKVDKKEQCTDPGQPYVVNPAGDGRSQVLCLKPSS